MIGKLIGLAISGPLRLSLTWDDDWEGEVDLAPIVGEHKALAPLRKAAVFKSVALSADGWSIIWDNDIEFGAPQLRRWAEEQAGQIMAPKAFKGWMSEHGLTLDAAAEALGLSRRMVAYYLSGEKPIPRTVMLATEGWSARAR